MVDKVKKNGQSAGARGVGPKRSRASGSRKISRRILGKSSGNRIYKAIQRAKWINSPEEHEDRAGQSLATRDHEVIRRWAEEREAHPATAPGAGQNDRSGVLRFNFPSYGGGTNAEKIGWDRWFQSFDERNLVFIFQEHVKNGNQSNFFRLDSPDRKTRKFQF